MAKGTLSIAGADTLTAADLAADSVGSSELAANAVGSSELADEAVTPAKIAYLGDGSGNLSGTITGEQLRFGNVFTLDDDLTINGDVTLGKAAENQEKLITEDGDTLILEAGYNMLGEDDSTGQTLTHTASTARVFTGTGTLRMGSSLAVSSVSGMTGVLDEGVTGGSGLTDHNRVSNIDRWRLTSSFTGAATPISSNLERDDTRTHFLGTGMSVTSGVWTFPSTGHWLVNAVGSGSESGAIAYLVLLIAFTANNGSSWPEEQEGTWNSSAAGARCGSAVTATYDITDVANQKIRFVVQTGNSSGTKFASSTANRFYFEFVKLSNT